MEESDREECSWLSVAADLQVKEKLVTIPHIVCKAQSSVAEIQSICMSVLWHMNGYAVLAIMIALHVT